MTHDGKGSKPPKKSLKSSDEIILPAKTSPLDKKSAEYNYYSYYYFYYYTEDSYWSAWLNYDCSFIYTHDDKTEYYSAWGCDNKPYFMNKYVNPYFGYRFLVQPVDASNSSFQVVFTNGVNTIYPKPNATQTYFPEGSSVVVDSGFSYFSPAGYYNYYYYNPKTNENYTYGSSSDDYQWDNETIYDYWRDSNEMRTRYTSDNCEVTMLTYIDGTSAPSYSYICSNGSYIFEPSAWYNYTYLIWDYSCNQTYNYTPMDESNSSDTNSSNSTTTTKRSSDYYDDYYYGGCYRNESYFYQETLAKYHFFANYSYSLTFNDSRVELHQYIDVYGAGFKTYVQTWTNGTCQMYQEEDGSNMWAKCANGSTMFYPPSDWFYTYYYYWYNRPDDESFESSN